MEYGFWTIIVAIAVGLSWYGLKRLDQYFKATIENTLKESIKHEYEPPRQHLSHELEIERQKMREHMEKRLFAITQKDTYRLAALDERMKAHQTAFFLAKQMRITLNGTQETKDKVTFDCDSFWNNHCLYLTNETRKAFSNALFSYVHMKSFEDELVTMKNEESRNDFRDARKQVYGLAEIIAKEIELEPIQEMENQKEGQ